MKRRRVLTKQDIDQMTEGQREIFFMGIKMERARILKKIETLPREATYGVDLIKEFIEGRKK